MRKDWLTIMLSCRHADNGQFKDCEMLPAGTQLRVRSSYSDSMCRERTHPVLNWKLPVQENLVKGILALELSLRIYFCYADLDYGQQLGGGTGNFAYTLCECWLLS